MTREDVQKVVVQFLSSKFSRPPETFSKDLDLCAAFQMDDGTLRAMISELAQYLFASLKLGSRGRRLLSQDVENWTIGASLTVGQLVDSMYLRYSKALNMSSYVGGAAGGLAGPASTKPPPVRPATALPARGA